MKLSFQKMFYVVATLFALFAILVLAKTILIPLSVALLMAFILFPLTKKLESWHFSKLLAAFLSLAVILLLIGGTILFFSTQLIELSKEFSHFKDNIIHLFADITLFINDNLNFSDYLEKDDLMNSIKTWVGNSTGSLLTKTFNSTTTFLAGLMATIIFTFLILLYRTGLTNAILAFAPEDKRERVLNMLRSVQKVGQNYLFGMMLLIGIIGLVNSVGLWIIGIDNAFLFGFLGASLSIIPYIGTSMGAVIPALYALMAIDSPWIALAVLILFWAVQVVSDNLLTPKIVGGSLKINALAVLLSLIIGAAVWGIAGMILFLPFAAMLRVICQEFDELKPIALLIGTYNYHDNGNEHHFIARLAKRIKGWFTKKGVTINK